MNRFGDGSVDIKTGGATDASELFPDRQDMNLEGDRGKRCELAGCNQLDFLPMRCDICARQFCATHINNHGCERSDGRRLPVCPICSKAIILKAGEDPDAAMSLHIESGCRARVRSVVDKARQESSKCNYGKGRKACKDTSAIKIKCGKCLKLFCVKHRDPAVHKCKGPDELVCPVVPSATALQREKSTDAMAKDLRRIARETSSDRVGMARAPSGGGAPKWNCLACTFENKGAAKQCAMCMTPKGAKFS